MRTLIGKMSMQSHLDELVSAIRTLAGQAFVRDEKIFGLGNSEGTLHVLNYQIHHPAIPLAGLVLIAPPGTFRRRCRALTACRAGSRHPKWAGIAGAV